MNGKTIVGGILMINFLTTYYPYVTLAVALIALSYVGITAKRVSAFPQGTDLMKKLSASIQAGASAFLKRQYIVVSIFFGVVFLILGGLALAGMMNPFMPFAFLTGGIYSGLAGFVGMKIATTCNARTAEACTTSLNKGLRIAFSAGSVMGFTVVGLGLLDVSIWLILLKDVFGQGADAITNAMITFGMGASSMALFARVGGGVFTKAADVGADLVGKVEAGIPEDDPRNPAVIADNVGDNVGDVAGMGADLYESYFGSLVSACALGVAAFRGAAETLQTKALIVPLFLAAIGILCSFFGTFLVRTKENASQKNLLSALRRGTNFSAVLVAVVAFPLVYYVLGKEYLGIYGAILSGLISGVLIGLATEFFTSDSYRPTKNLAANSETGSATIIIGGVSLGMLSTALPIVIIVACILIAFFVAQGNTGNAEMGLYGIALAAVGMLSTLGITLATDAYGPIADNAGGIAEMSGLDHSVRERTDALDSLGNTTAATGKGFAIGSAALTALALVASYRDQIVQLAAEKGINFTFDMNLMNPTVLAGLLIGACLPFVFAALTMSSVGRAAQSIVREVRRQFKEIAGIMEGKAEPDYKSCVDLCTRSSLKEMVLPTIIAIVVPVICGLILGPNGVIGLLAGSTATGFLLAIFMSNSGGAWDNAKKYIETGAHSGKGSSQHKAAVVGDTVGDPFKDTSGPAINILIKLLSIVSIVFGSLVLSFHLL